MSDRIRQEIEALGARQEAHEAMGEQGTVYEDPDADPALLTQFWQQVTAYETAPWTTHREQLQRAGVRVRDPAEIPEEEIGAALWELASALAEQRVFLECTDHLSDRELYEYLWREALSEPVKDLPPHPDSGWHIDLGGSCGEDLDRYLRYYADEETREGWARDFPEDTIPPHEEPPYDRDRTLPQRW